jgi:hypothetical protein
LNIRDFATAMEKLADYLEGIADWFAELRQQELDMRSEARGY